MKAYFIAILTLFTCIATVVRAQQMSELENRIDSLLNGKKATVGIAVWTDKGDMLRYNDHVHFPLLSVFKFHVALAVLDKMDKQSISLDSIVSIKASQMLPNTYSPLRKKFPDQDFTITLRELMQYSISQSDNNSCDIDCSSMILSPTYWCTANLIVRNHALPKLLLLSFPLKFTVPCHVLSFPPLC